MTRFFIISPPAAGKTHHAATHDDVFDSDDAVPSTAWPSIIAAVRRQDWQAANDLRLPAVTTWAANLQPGSIITAVNFEEWRAMGGTLTNTVVVVPLIPVHDLQMTQRGFDDQARRTTLAIASDVKRRAIELHIPRFRDFPNALWYLRKLRLVKASTREA